MLYAPTNWLDELTKLGPTNLNKLEAGTADASGHHRSGAGRPAAAAGNAGWLWRDPDGTVLLSDGAAWAVFAAGGIPFVTALPTGAAVYDGQEVYYLAEPTNNPGVVWHLKYRAAEAGPYKWYFVGGQPTTAVVNTSETAPASLGSFQDLATAGPALAFPLPGDYQYAGELQATTPGGVTTWGWSFFDAANTQLDPGFAQGYFDTAAVGNSEQDQQSKSGRVTNRAAGSQIKLRYLANRAAVTFRDRRLYVTPIRVSA